MTQTPRKIPTHETTYARLRDMVLFGRLAPGQPVTIQGLTDMLDAGMTPVREALRRLTAEGALTLLGNRRVVVPRLTPAALEDLAFVRLSIERRLAERAAPNLTPDLIAALVAEDAATDRAIGAGDIEGYLEHNYRFHFLIYEAADAEVLADIARSLWLRFGPSLRVLTTRYGTSGLPDTHADALAAMRAGDGAALGLAIERDIAAGVDQVRLALAAGEI